MSDCNLLRRALALAPPPPRRREGRDAGCRRSSPGCRLPAGTGLSRRTSSPQSSARCSPSTAARGSRRRVRGGHRRCSRAGPSQPRPRHRLPRGRRRRALRALTAGRPALPEAPAEARARRRHDVRRGRPALLASGARRARSSSTREKKVTSARRRLHERRPVALHVAPLLGGRARRAPTSAPAGSGATSTASGRRTTRSRDSRSTARSPPALATAKVPVASIDGARPVRLLEQRASGARSSSACSRAIGRLGARRPTATRGSRRRQTPPRRSTGCATSCRSVPGRRKPVHEPGAVPELGRRVPAAARGARRDARGGTAAPRRRADGRRRATTRTPTRRGALRTGCSSPRTRCSRSSATSRRAASPTACSCTSGRSSAGAPRRTAAAAPTTARRASGFLIGTRVNGQMVGEFPGLRTARRRRQRQATADFRGVYAALLEQWLGVDAEAIIPGAHKFKRPTILR